ncbi:MAG: ABC transporter permease [Gemmatimonadota bacterium]|jgi:phospholipid/cholesterol/gamma-HCH transport system permease protein
MIVRKAALTPVRYAGSSLRELAWHTQRYFTLLWRSIHGSFTRPFYGKDLAVQLDSIGVGSIGIVILTGLFTGMVLALQSAVEMRQFGATIYIGRLVGASTVRELGPVLTALMVTGRAGSGIAAELGAMRVTEQIDALNTMGVDPVRKLVVPRFVACLIALPLLTIVTDLVAIFGGLLIAIVKLDLTFDLYMRSVYSTLAQNGFLLRYVPIDFVSGLSKPLFFGAIIAITSCYYGLSTRGGTEGVGRAATGAVVTSSIFILATDYFLTQLIIGLFIE